MPRVKGGTVTRKRRKKVLKLAKGYFGSKPPSSVLPSYYTKPGANHTTISLENRVYVFRTFFLKK